MGKARSCDTKTVSAEVIERLATVIRERRSATGDQSYTRKLLDKGLAKCAKKFGEESVEVVIAATSEDDAALANEAADVIYHLLVLLECREVGFERVCEVLDGRMGTSGLAEKAARGKGAGKKAV